VSGPQPSTCTRRHPHPGPGPPLPRSPGVRSPITNSTRPINVLQRTVVPGIAADYGPNMAPLRVVFADDNYLVREGVAALLAEVPEIELVQIVADPQSLLKAVAEQQPEAVLTDIRMPPSHTNEGIVAAKQIRATHPKTGVGVLSQYVEEEYAFELLSEGVAGMGYLLKERVSQLDELVRALHEVARGGSVLDPKVVEGLLSRKASEARSPLLGLTDREREVLQEMATGRNNAMIAKTLFMSERAVEKHIGSVFQKLGLVEEGEVNRRVMAVLAFLEATAPNR
jgi:DNA-binding NarL/FixJ family response regulator